MRRKVTLAEIVDTVNMSLLVNVWDNMRQVSVDLDPSTNMITLYVYFDDEPTKEQFDTDAVGDITTEIISAYLDDFKFDERFHIVPEGHAIKTKGIPVFQRKEPNFNCDFEQYFPFFRDGFIKGLKIINLRFKCIFAMLGEITREIRKISIELEDEDKLLIFRVYYNTSQESADELIIPFKHAFESKLQRVMPLHDFVLEFRPISWLWPKSWLGVVSDEFSIYRIREVFPEDV